MAASHRSPLARLAALGLAAGRACRRAKGCCPWEAGGAGGQALVGIGADRLQHAVVDLAAGLAGHQQGLVHQAGEQIEHVALGEPRLGVRARIGADPFGGLQSAAAAEHRQAGEQGPLGLVEQLPAPVDHRPQGLLPWQRGAAAGGPQPEAVVQAGGDLLGRQRAQPRGGQLDRQGHSVQPAADLGGGGLVPVLFAEEREARAGRLGAVGEQPHGGVVGRRDRCGAGGRDVERRHRPQRLAGDAERFAAGRQDPHAGAGRQDRPCEPRGGIGQRCSQLSRPAGTTRPARSTRAASNARARLPPRETGCSPCQTLIGRSTEIRIEAWCT